MLVASTAELVCVLSSTMQQYGTQGVHTATQLRIPESTHLHGHVCVLFLCQRAGLQ